MREDDRAKLILAQAVAGSPTWPDVLPASGREEGHHRNLRFRCPNRRNSRIWFQASVCPNDRGASFSARGLNLRRETPT
jgi:hypothetical protein